MFREQPAGLCQDDLRLKTKELKENDSSAASFIFL
jgi:hypothetical protein